MPPPLILGIDLGTTFSLAATMTPAGPIVIRDERGNALVPSVISFGQDGSVVVGAAARAQAVANPLRTVYSVKRLMGRGIEEVQEDLRHLAYPVVSGRGGTVCVTVGDREMTPQELSALILREVKARAEVALGQRITQAVITVPAYFDDSQRQATRDAGAIAGLDVRRIVNEPTAAALAYGLDRKAQATLAVYDLGGGTFDVSILRVDKGVFQVLSTDGDTHLGGDDLDMEIIDLLTADLRRRFGEGLTFPPATRQALRDLAEAAKIRLSTEPAARVEVDLGDGRQLQRTITREEFESAAARWIDHTIEHCRAALAAAGLKPEQIDEVVMVGGCTRIPLVLQARGGVLRSPALHRDQPRRGGGPGGGRAGGDSCGHPARHAPAGRHAPVAGHRDARRGDGQAHHAPQHRALPGHRDVHHLRGRADRRGHPRAPGRAGAGGRLPQPGQFSVAGHSAHAGGPAEDPGCVSHRRQRHFKCLGPRAAQRQGGLRADRPRPRADAGGGRADGQGVLRATRKRIWRPIA